MTLLNPYRFGVAGSVSINNASYTRERNAPFSSTSRIILAIDGSFTGEKVAGINDEYDWLTAGNAADFDARMTMISGSSFTNAALNAWLNLGTERIWQLTRNGSFEGSSVGTGLLEIRPSGGGAVLDSATISLTATVNPEPDP